jgi:hypothetical protein
MKAVNAAFTYLAPSPSASGVLPVLLANAFALGRDDLGRSTPDGGYKRSSRFYKVEKDFLLGLTERYTQLQAQQIGEMPTYMWCNLILSKSVRGDFRGER